MRVLIVEDDPLLGDPLAVGLKQRGFEPDWVQERARSADADARRTICGHHPRSRAAWLTGLELLRTERAWGNKVP